MKKNLQLINIRKAKGITQKQMAAAVNIKQTNYSKKELGISKIREEEWACFAKVLDVNISEIKDDFEELIITKRHYDTLIQQNQELKSENRVLKQKIKILTN